MIVLITGCRSGFGLLAAVSAAKAGHVVYAGLRDLSTADNLRAAADGLEVIPVQLDVTDAEQRAAVIARIHSERGRLDGLVNNAGVAIAGAVEELTEAEFRKVMEVNLFGLWSLTNLALPGMRAQGSGVILNVSSMAGRMAMPTLGIYAASKHALSGMSEAMRFELAPFGVKVALVEPGPYKTDILGRNKNLCAAAQSPDSPYASLYDKIGHMADKLTDTAGDAQDVADRIVSLLGLTDPPFRNPMGPNTAARRLLRWALPHGGYEAVLKRVIEKG